MRFLGFALALLAVAAPIAASARPPIIDMHLHARRAAYAGANPPPMCAPFAIMPRWDPARPLGEAMTFNAPPCEHPIPAVATDEQAMRETIAVMERRNIIGMVSGEPDLMRVWRAAAPRRIMTGLDFRLPGTTGHRHVLPRTPAEVRALHAQGAFRILAEMMAQYEGVAPDDPRLAPYWALAEELDIPVGIHMGPGEPGQSYAGGGYRVALGNPLLLEPVLNRHPRLRLYIMHAAYPMITELRALMFSYPQVYVDTGLIVYAEPRPAFYRFLRELVEAGYGDRIMFGSDQMIWPGIIEPSIRAIEEADFLTEAQRRDILYNNAARFLRLSPEEIARHHAM